MIIYISGKIGEKNISDATRKRFAKVQAMLEAEGHTVFNPTSPEWQSYLRTWMKGRESYLANHNISEYAEALRLDMGIINECDAIYLLSNFLDSPGAKAEHAFAIACQKKIFYDDELYRNGTLRAKIYEKNKFPWSK